MAMISRRALCSLAAAVLALALALLAGCSTDRPTAPIVGTSGPPLLLAFSSDRPPSRTLVNDIYFADLAAGGPPFMPPNANSSSDEGPCALSGDGRTLCITGSRIFLGTTTQIALMDVATGAMWLPARTRLLAGPSNPSLSYDGRYLATNYRVGTSSEAIAVEDLAADTLLPLPNLNPVGLLAFDPSLNGDGTLIAFSTFGLVGGYDIALYSVPGDSLVPLPGLNSSSNDLSAAISADGRWIAFQSGRPGGVGVIDAYLYDRQTSSLVPLPGLNTPLADVQTSISPDGRYITCMTDAEGGQDVRVYDVVAQRLVPLAAGVNDPVLADQYPVLADRPAHIAR
jgi:Tol biopolymer transport system component